MLTVVIGCYLRSINNEVDEDNPLCKDKVLFVALKMDILASCAALWQNSELYYFLRRAKYVHIGIIISISL